MVREPVFQGGESDDAGDGTGGQAASGTRAGDGTGGQAASGTHDDEANLHEQLRPQRMEDVVGQRDVVDRLRIMLNAAQKRGEPLSHLLLDGPPGLGKTTFAQIIPREMGTECQYTSGPALTAPKDLLPYLTNCSYGSVLFIDEIHRMPPAVEEFIYPAMEDFRVDICLGEGLNARTINLKLKPFTLIGATTRSGMLTAPLRDRFINREHLEFYDDDDLAEIVQRNARKLGREICKEAAFEIARRSRGTPRHSNSFLRWTRDYTDSEADGSMTHEITLAAFGKRDVDEIGLDGRDRKYLRALLEVFGGGPAGIQALGHSTNIPPDTLEDEVEPFLLRCKFLKRTPRGRMITVAACTHLGLEPPPVDPRGHGRLF